MAARLFAIVLVIGLGVASACATGLAWFIERSYGGTERAARGYETAAGSLTIAFASVGAAVALFAGVLVSRRLVRAGWLLTLGLAVATVVAIALAALTYTTREFAVVESWRPTAGYWVALATASVWAVTALGAAVVRLHQPFPRISLAARPTVASRVTTASLAAFLAAILLVLGAIGPWQTTGFAARSGLDDFGDGTVVAAAGFLAALRLVAYWRLGRRGSLLAALVLGVVATAICIADASEIASADESVAGWGIVLSVLAGSALTLASLIEVVYRGRSLVAPGEDENVRRTPLVDVHVIESPAVAAFRPTAAADDDVSERTP